LPAGDANDHQHVMRRPINKMSKQGVAYAFTVIFLLLVAINF